MINNKQSQQSNNLRIMSFNANGLYNKQPFIEQFLSNNSIHFCFTCETWLPPNYHLKNNMIFHLGHVKKNNRGRYPYGLAILINPKLVSKNDFTFIVSNNHNVLIFELFNIRFFGVYIPPDTDPFVTIKEDTFQVIREHLVEKPSVLLGDWNARNTKWNDFITNPIGTWLKEKCTSYKLSRLEPDSGMWTLFSHRRVNQTISTVTSIVDHILVNDEALELIVNFHVHESQPLGGSDHRPLVLECNLPDNTPLPQIQTSSSHLKSTWSRKALKDENICNNYIQTLLDTQDVLKTLLAPIISNPYAGTQVNVDFVDKIFISWIQDALSFAKVPFINRVPKKREKSSEYLSPDLVQLDHEIGLTELEGKSVTDLKNTLREKINAKRDILKAEYKAFLSELEPMEMLKFTKSLKGKSKSDCLLDYSQQSVNQLAAIFQANCTNNLPKENSEFKLPYGPCRSSCPIQGIFNTPNIMECLKNKENGKATGLSLLPVEVFKVASMVVAPIMQEIFSFYAEHGITPTSWNQVIIKPIPKKGNLRLPENYRPISLVEVTRKIFETLLLPWLTAKIPLDATQGGFRLRRGTADQAIILQEWIRLKKLIKKKPIFIAFLDIKAAYDGVDRDILWAMLRLHLDDKMLSLLQSLFDHNRSVVQFGEFKSREIIHHAGLLQGSILSPLLYASFINVLCEELRDSLEDQDFPLNSLFYADDIALFCDDPTKLQNLLNICERASKRLRFLFNVKKCEIISDTLEHPFYLYNQKIPFSLSFSYLGFPIDSDGFCEEEFLKNTERKITAMTNMLKGYNLDSKLLPFIVVGRIFKCFIQPIADYGLLFLKNITKSMKRLTAILNTSKRSLFRVDINTSMDSIDIVARIENLSLRREKLTARLLLKATKKDDSFALFLARQASLKMDCSFFTQEKSNPILNDQAEEFKDKVENRKRFYLKRTIDNYEMLSFFRNKDMGCIDRLVRELNKLEIHDFNILLRFCAGKFHGKITCHACGIIKTSTKHIMDCGRMSIRNFLNTACTTIDFFLVALRIQDIVRNSSSSSSAAELAYIEI